jgi:hypothetical protein
MADADAHDLSGLPLAEGLSLQWQGLLPEGGVRDLQVQSLAGTAPWPCRSEAGVVGSNASCRHSSSPCNSTSHTWGCLLQGVMCACKVMEAAGTLIM